MFEFFNAPNAALVPKLVLPLYSVGQTSGLSVDSGYGHTQVIPVFEGYPLRHAMRSMPIGGFHVTQHIMKLLNERSFNFTEMNNWNNIRDIKEQICYCALDYETEMAAFTKEMAHEYKLPDGMIVLINNEALVFLIIIKKKI